MHPPAKTPVPSPLSTKICPLFAKLSNPPPNIRTQKPIHTCVICIRKSWMNSNVADALKFIHGLDVHRKNKKYSAKQTGDGVFTCMNSSWSGMFEPIYSYLFSGVGCLANYFYPNFSWQFRSSNFIIFVDTQLNF